MAATLTAPAAMWNSTGQFIAGAARWNDATLDHFTGDIDDVRAYQQALTSDQIESQMND